LQKYGYDLLDNLPAVIFDIDGHPINQVRHHYHDCKTSLFVDATARQIGEWCGKNGLKFVGHLLHETYLSNQASCVGSVMRFYEHMQVPGIDSLTDRHVCTDYRPEYDTPKQCASILNQCNKEQMFSELYGCAGWDFSFEGNKVGGDWQAALGVNLRSVMSWYTMAGQSKREYPASTASQSPWWEKYSGVEDYFARINVLMSRGSAVRRLLIVHPLESMCQLIKRNWRDNEEYKKLDTQTMDLSEWLLESQIDFDYGDEEMLSRLTSVQNKNGKVEFVVGNATYDTVLFPPLLTVRQSTLSIVKEFAEAGGNVVFSGLVPEYVDAKPSTAAIELAEQAVKINFDKAEIIKAVESTRKITICDLEGSSPRAILYMLREDEQRNKYLFLCNTDRQNKYQNITIKIQHTGETLEEWDALTGQIYKNKFERDGDDIIFTTHFESSGSILFALPSKATDKLSERPKLTTVFKENLEELWEYSLTEPNVVVLDTPQYKINDSQWNAPTEILKIDNLVRNVIEKPLRGGINVQPWAQKEKPKSKSCHIELLFEFDLAKMPSAPISLAIEQPERFTLKLNDSPIDADNASGWWVDQSIHTIPLAHASLKSGRNTVSLMIDDYSEKDGLEMIFLLGDFGVNLVDNTPTITELPLKLSVGDWVKQALPFYSGAVRYETSISLKNQPENSLAFIELPEFAGTCVCISVNNKALKTLSWPPYEVDITEALEKGINKLVIEVYSHRRNSFGPLHLVGEGPRPGWTGRGEYLTEGKEWQDEYNLVSCGLLKTPVLSYRITN